MDDYNLQSGNHSYAATARAVTVRILMYSPINGGLSSHANLAFSIFTDFGPLDGGCDHK